MLTENKLTVKASRDLVALGVPEFSIKRATIEQRPTQPRRASRAERMDEALERVRAGKEPPLSPKMKKALNEARKKRF